MAQALFRLVDEVFLSSGLTRGGWSDDSQHGGPPCGLLARAVEQVPTAVPMQVVRFTVDLFRSVPLTPLRVETEVIRDGRRIQVVQARLSADEREVGRAHALKIRRSEARYDLSGLAEPSMPQPGPDSLEPLDWRGSFGADGSLERFHTDAVEVRTIDHSFVRPGPGESWARMTATLVEGEDLTPFQRVATLADLANGNSQALDSRRWLYINPDNTVYLSRLPEGEWIGMRSRVHQDPVGIGVTETELYDLEGRIGQVSQAQLIEPR